jgi:hypothetical protein
MGDYLKDILDILSALRRERAFRDVLIEQSALSELFQY